MALISTSWFSGVVAPGIRVMHTDRMGVSTQLTDEQLRQMYNVEPAAPTTTYDDHDYDYATGWECRPPTPTGLCPHFWFHDEWQTDNASARSKLDSRCPHSGAGNAGAQAWIMYGNP